MNLLIHILITTITYWIYPLQKETVFLYFDANNQETCTISNSQTGRFHSDKPVKRYEKIIQEDKTINFYICNELFKFSSNSSVDTLSIDLIDTLSFSSIQDLLDKASRENPLYPANSFEKVFLIEKINDSTVVKYDVKWKYYME